MQENQRCDGPQRVSLRLDEWRVEDGRQDSVGLLISRERIYSVVFWLTQQIKVVSS